jgi:hypothetical protein
MRSVVCVKSVGIDPRFSAAAILVRQGSGFGLIGRGQVLCDRMYVLLLASFLGVCRSGI